MKIWIRKHVSTLATHGLWFLALIGLTVVHTVKVTELREVRAELLEAKSDYKRVHEVWLHDQHIRNSIFESLHKPKEIIDD